MEGLSMPQILLNASVIDALPKPETGQRIYYDSKLPGFGVRITKSAKSYIAEARASGRKRRVTIASVGVLPPSFHTSGFRAEEFVTAFPTYKQ